MEKTLLLFKNEMKIKSVKNVNSWDKWELSRSIHGL